MSSQHARARDSIKGSWSEAEDNQLRRLVDNGSNTNWSLIAEHMKGRSAKQCRERWVQNLRPNLSHEPLTAEECHFIMHQVREIGKKWAEISRRMEHKGMSVRSDNAVKNWYNGTVHREERALRRRREHPNAHHHHQQRSGPRDRSTPIPLGLLSQRELPLPSASGSPSVPVSPMSASSVHSDHDYYRPSGPLHHQQPSGRHLPVLHGIHGIPAPHHSLDHDAEAWQYPFPAFAHHQQQQQQHPDRRMSVMTTLGSEMGEANEHGYVPSLVSDTGSPLSQHDSPSHASVPLSFNALPPLQPTDDHSAKASRRLPSLMMRSFSDQSDETSLQPLTIEPQCRPSDVHDRGQTDSFSLAFLR